MKQSLPAALMVLLAAANALVARPPRAFPARSGADAAPDVSMAASGLHGDQSHFMPIDQLGGDQTMPRIVPIAGVYPGVSAADVRAPAVSAPPELGNWQYDFADPDGPQMGTVALPPSDLVNLCESPVVLITTHQSLGFDAPGDDNELEVLLLVDRADVEHNEDKFYVFEQSPGGELVVRWHPSPLPEGWSVVGRLVTVTLPFVRKAMQVQGGWLELDDDIF